ncbi:LysR family transcriptional regulator [Acetobacteraceae bacterium H6797]|nr:LysR family transcriptional regulator [Acetobacteraceae bacterium H6797]
MDQTRLRMFLAIAEHGGFSRAAAALGLAQPSLSRQIATLEAECGRPLLYRHGRGASLTEEGQRLADAARPLLAALDALPAALADPAPRGNVVLGMPTFISAQLAGPLFTTFRSRHPGINLRLMDGFSGFVNQWLIEGRVDVAVVYDARRSRVLLAEPLAEEVLWLFGNRRRASELPPGEAVPPSALSGLDLILPARAHGLRRALDRAGARPDPARLLEVDSLTAIRALVDLDAGWSVLPQAGLVRERDDPRLLLRPIGMPLLRVRIMMAATQARPVTPAGRAVMRFLREAVRELQARGVMSAPDTHE